MNAVDTAGAPVAEHGSLEALAWIPVTISLEAKLSEFVVRDLLRFRVGSIVRSVVPQAAMMPLAVNGKRMAWAKVEVIGDCLAARVMELAR